MPWLRPAVLALSFAALAASMVAPSPPARGSSDRSFDLTLRLDRAVGYRFHATSDYSRTLGLAPAGGTRLEYGLTVYLGERTEAESVVRVRFDRVRGAATDARGATVEFDRASGAAHDGRPETAPVGQEVSIVVGGHGAIRRIEGLERAYRAAGDAAGRAMPRAEQVLRSIVGSRPRSRRPKAVTWRAETRLPTDGQDFVARTYYRVEEISADAVSIELAGSATPEGHPPQRPGAEDLPRAVLNGTARVSTRDGLPLELRSTFVRTLVRTRPDGDTERVRHSHAIEIERRANGPRPDTAR